jgi:hypothetical protein
MPDNGNFSAIPEWLVLLSVYVSLCGTHKASATPIVPYTRFGYASNNESPKLEQKNMWLVLLSVHVEHTKHQQHQLYPTQDLDMQAIIILSKLEQKL